MLFFIKMYCYSISYFHIISQMLQVYVKSKLIHCKEFFIHIIDFLQSRELYIIN